jgi:ATP-binding cassette subfamily F protein uup
MSLYSITGAQLAFGHVALLDHADFSLEAGERVGLIGRNGAGKSSLLKIVAGLAKPDDGLITRQQEARDRLRAAGARIRAGRDRVRCRRVGAHAHARSARRIRSIAHRLAETPEGAEHDALLARMTRCSRRSIRTTRGTGARAYR